MLDVVTVVYDGDDARRAPQGVILAVWSRFMKAFGTNYFLRVVLFFLTYFLACFLAFAFYLIYFLLFFRHSIWYIFGDSFGWGPAGNTLIINFDDSCLMILVVVVVVVVAGVVAVAAAVVTVAVVCCLLFLFLFFLCCCCRCYPCRFFLSPVVAEHRQIGGVSTVFFWTSRALGAKKHRKYWCFFAPRKLTPRYLGCFCLW